MALGARINRQEEKLERSWVDTRFKPRCETDSTSPLYQACDWRGWKATVTAAMDEAIEGRATMNREVAQLKEREQMELKDNFKEFSTFSEVSQGRKDGNCPEQNK